MRSEAPIISKALRLASVIVIVAIVALAASVGYSVFQEYKVLGSVFSPQGNQGNSQVLQSMNGSQLSLSGISIPNNMTYPLTLQLGGEVYLAGVHVSSFVSPVQVIAPGAVGQLQLSASLNYSKIFANSTALQEMLMQPATLSASVSIFAEIDPIAGLNLTNVSNQTIGPVLGQFSANPQSPYLNGTNYVFPLQVSWDNQSPLQFAATLNAEMTGMPGQPAGNYSSASGPLNIVQGPNQETLYFYLPVSQIHPQNIHGEYDFELTVSADGASVTIPESVNY
jgi:hypothetical protein